jgi:hypothetical protein
MADQSQSSVIAKRRILTDRIIANTRRGTIKWKETAQPDNYLMRIGKVVVSFGVEIGVEGDPAYFLQIEDSDGKVIERFNDENIDGADRGGQYFKKMRDFHGEIARILSGADKLIDELLSSLDPTDEEILF